MSVARFPIFGFLDRAKASKGAVEIDRDTKMFTVRPHRSQQTYSMPLDVVASMVVRASVQREVRDKVLEKAAAKKAKG